MGWLPIALALTGFAFFVFIINYNSIKTQEEAINLAFFNLCQTAKARHTLLLFLQEIEPDNWASTHPERSFHLKKYPEYLGLIRKEIQSVEKSKLIVEVNKPADRDTRKKLKSLQVLNHRQQIFIKIFNRKVREYNNLISSYPTAMVAKAAGYHPLQA